MKTDNGEGHRLHRGVLVALRNHKASKLTADLHNPHANLLTTVVLDLVRIKYKHFQKKRSNLQYRSVTYSLLTQTICAQMNYICATLFYTCDLFTEEKVIRPQDQYSLTSIILICSSLLKCLTIHCDSSSLIH